MSKVYAVWWRTAGEKNFGDGPMNWVGAFTDYEKAKIMRDLVAGDWISTGIQHLELDPEPVEGWTL